MANYAKLKAAGIASFLSKKASTAIKKFSQSEKKLNSVKKTGRVSAPSVNLGKLTKIKIPKEKKLAVLKKAVKNVGF
ncbi:MAG: hypothetical protein WC069_05945 [Candidatus Shapirobacteria bacterium]